MKVRCYFNLHKHCISVQQKKNNVWLVIDHVKEISLVNVIFKVSEPGRQRVLKEKRKNVHAYIIGDISNSDISCSRIVNYNPYKYSTFVCDNAPIYNAEACIINGKSVKAK